MEEFNTARFGNMVSTGEKNCETHGAYIGRGLRLPSGNIVGDGCPECTKERQQKEANEQELERQRQIVAAAQRRIEERISRAGIPARFKSKTFDSFFAADVKQKKALDISVEFAENFAEHSKRGTFVVFSGQPGTGKSHLAIAIMKSVLQNGTAIYTSAIDAVRMIRNTWRRDSEKTELEILDILSGVDLLVLDEIGVQYGTEAEQISLFDIIDKRYRDMMPTILLTNQNKAGLKAFLGDRSFDRLREGGIWVTFDWQSRRGTNTED